MAEKLTAFPMHELIQHVDVCCRKLPGDYVDLCGITELREESFAVFPREAECADVGDEDPGYNVANGQKMSWIELVVHQCRFCSGYQAIQR